MRKSHLKIFVFTFVVILFFFVRSHDLLNYLNFAYIKSNQLQIQELFAANSLQFILSYMFIYIVIAALSIPGGATLLTLAGGATFGFWLGLAIVSVASTIGATLAFLIARYLLRDFIQEKFKEKLIPINQGFEKDGGFYLFTLRIVPIFPFFIVNLVMGLTPIKVTTYFFISQVGMLLGTAVYVNAGMQISKLESLEGILSPTLIASFILLGILPLVAKKVISLVKRN